jgi:hypothetical protein
MEKSPLMSFTSRQQISPSGQSAFPLHSMRLPLHVSVAVWHCSAPLPVPVPVWQQWLLGTAHGPGHWSSPGVQGAPPTGPPGQEPDPLPPPVLELLLVCPVPVPVLVA